MSCELGDVSVALTLFSIKIKTNLGIKLNDKPFSTYRNGISSPTDYSISQLLGKNMREEKIEAFTFQSARAVAGTNIGLFSMDAFAEKHPKSESFQTWQSITTKSSVEFVRMAYDKEQSFTFPIDIFL